MADTVKQRTKRTWGAYKRGGVYDFTAKQAEANERVGRAVTVTDAPAIPESPRPAASKPAGPTLTKKHTGAGWYDIRRGGETVDRVRGKDEAERYIRQHS